MTPVRPSMADVARHCGHAPALAAANPGGNIYTIRGTGKHKVMERAVKSGTLPDEPSLAAGLHIIRSLYPEATWEAEVAVELFDPDTGERLITEGTGTADLVGTLPDQRIVVGDYKFGFTPVDHPDDGLQAREYALAIALKRGAPAFQAFIWQPEVDGITQSRWYHDGADYWGVLNEIRAMCNLPNEPTDGPWCSKCFQQSKCTKFMLAAHTGASALEPFTRPMGLTIDNFLEAKNVVTALKKAAEIGDERLKAFVRETGEFISEGREVSMRTSRGRRYVDLSAVETAGLTPHLERAGAIKRARDSESISIRNAKGKAGKVNGATSAWLEREPPKKIEEQDGKPKRKRKTA